MIQSYCTQCGARLPETGAFCPICGARTQRDTLPSVPPTVQVPSVAQAPPTAPVAPVAPAPKATVKRPSHAMRRSPALAFSLLAVATVVGAAVYFAAIRPRQSAAIVEPCVAGQDCAPTAIADVHDESGIPYPDVERIPVAEARARYDAGQALFIDVRDAEAYAAAHIPESLSLPLTELEAGIPPLARNSQIITYCT